MNLLEKIVVILSFLGIMFCGTSILVSCQIVNDNSSQEPVSVYSETIIPSLGDD